MVLPSRATDRAHARAGGLGVRERDGYRGGHQLFPLDLCGAGGKPVSTQAPMDAPGVRGPGIRKEGRPSSHAVGRLRLHPTRQFCEAVPPRSLFCEAPRGEAATGIEVLPCPSLYLEKLSGRTRLQTSSGMAIRRSIGTSLLSGRICNGPARAPHLPSMIRNGSSVIAGM